MSHRIYILRNLKTEKEHQVDEAGLAALKAQDWLKRYTIVEERIAHDKPKTTFIPSEIAEASRNAAEDVKAGLIKEKTGRAPRG